MVQRIRYVKNYSYHLPCLNDSIVGDIVYTEVLGTKFVILGSSKRANDLFMERSAIYSDRMLSPMMDLRVIQSLLKRSVVYLTA